MLGWSTALVVAIASLYIGYSVSIISAPIGAIWAFVDRLVAGVVLQHDQSC